jgi:hypothetical protein
MFAHDAEVITLDGYEYTKSNHRLKFNKEFHTKRTKPYTTAELMYMCSMWDGTKKAVIAMALERTHGAILTKKTELTQTYIGDETAFEYYKRRGKEL